MDSNDFIAMMRMKFVAIVALPSELPIEFWPFEEPIIYSGVGKLNAAFTTMRAISKYQPDLILNLGTVGSLNDQLKNVVEINRVIQRDFDAEPLAPRGTVPFEDFPSELFSGYGDASCGTGDTFVRVRENWLLNKNIDVVDMELFAIAKICTQLDTPWRSFKLISDYVNHDSDSDWERNLQFSHIELIGFVANKLKLTF
jgi:adenosylhomocysteine nucleosidase